MKIQTYSILGNSKLHRYKNDKEDRVQNVPLSSW